jgi:RelA/SpoT family (p)ppGpp synthetase
MHTFRTAFEDLGFATLYPYRYRVLKNAVKKARGNRLEIVNEIETKIKETLTRAGIPPLKLSGREKHLFSIYKKMRNKHIPFSEIMDVYAFRIIVDSVDTCYRVLGAVHNLYRPVPERFKDYIAIPKANGYQSLHTTLFGPYGVPLEIQIRTEPMDALADSGVASHWLYKADNTTENQAHVRAQEWLKRVLELQSATGNSIEFIENVKIDLFPDEVYVFTPKGNILELPNGASAVDFAYEIHTDIGDTAVAAKIDRRLSPLSTQLANGQTVEIITSPSAKPNPTWLNFVVTAKARSAIRHFLKRQKQSESIYLGKRLIERALSTIHLTLAEIPQANIQQVLKDSHLKTIDDLLETLGLGHLSPLMVARRLAFVEKAEAEQEAQEKQEATDQLSHTPLLIEGTEGMVLQFATCCYPIPGDPILGVLDAGRGIMVHTQNCAQIAKLRATERAIYLSWEPDVQGAFPVVVDAELLNRKGVLAALTLAVANADANIDNITVVESDGNYSGVSMIVSVRNRQHLANLLRSLRKIPEASKIVRRQT